MKNIFVNTFCLLSFFIFINCGEKQKTEPKKEEVKKEIEEPKSKDLIDFIVESHDNSKEVNTLLGGLFSLKKVSLFVDPNSDDNIYITFSSNSEITENDLSNYKLHLKIFPYEQDLSLLREDTKDKKKGYDSWYFKPKLESKDGVTFLYKKLDTPLSEFRQIYIQLYDETKKKIVPESVVVKDLLIN